MIDSMTCDSRGADNVQSIELLMGSHDELDALKSATSDRPRLFTLLLVVLWPFGYIGSQAVLHSLNTQPNFTTKPIPLSYMSTDPRVATQYDSLPGVPDFVNGDSEPQALFASVLFSTSAQMQHLNGTPQQASFDDLLNEVGGVNSAIQKSLRDPWGHPRIPIPDLLPGFKNGSDSWIEVPQDRILPSSSAFGIPIIDMPSSEIGSSNFTIRSAFTEFKVSLPNFGKASI
jgi:hypothetical protein